MAIFFFPKKDDVCLNAQKYTRGLSTCEKRQRSQGVAKERGMPQPDLAFCS
jgi:hypothetical protein